MNGHKKIYLSIHLFSTTMTAILNTGFVLFWFDVKSFFRRVLRKSPTILLLLITQLSVFWLMSFFY